MLRSWRATEVEASGQILLCHWSKMPCLSSEGPHGHSMGTRKSHPFLEFKPVFKQHQATWSAGLLNTESVQFSCSVVSDSLQPHGLQHDRLPCPSPTPGACSNSCPFSWWCHPTISSSVTSVSSHLQSCPTSGSFPVTQFFASGGQNIGASASASVHAMNI